VKLNIVFVLIASTTSCSGAGSSDDFTFNPCLASLHTYLGGWRWRLETFCCSYFGFCFQCTLFELGNYHIACVWQRLKTLIIDWLFWMEVPFWTFHCSILKVLVMSYVCLACCLWICVLRKKWWSVIPSKFLSYIVVLVWVSIFIMLHAQTVSQCVVNATF